MSATELILYLLGFTALAGVWLLPNAGSLLASDKTNLSTAFIVPPKLLLRRPNLVKCHFLLALAGAFRKPRVPTVVQR